MKRALLAIVLVACGPKAKPDTTPAPMPAPDPAPAVVTQPAPVPADPAPVTDGDVTDAWVGGIHVLVKRIPGAETVSTQLYIQGGVRNWGKADAGIEQLAISAAASGGTTKLDKDAFTKKLAELGSSLGAGADSEFSQLNSWSLLPAWEETFALQADAFLNPALPPSEIELQRMQLLGALKAEQSNPDAKLRLLAETGMYRGHPYANRAIGTIESVTALGREQLVAHLAKLRETSRLLLVVVGDLEAKRVLDVTRRLLGDLPRGTYRATEMPAWKSDKGEVTIVEQKLPTTYIQSVFPGPSPRDPEWPVAQVAMSALRARLFEEVRTKRNLSYAPGAWFRGASPVTNGGLYVTAVDPKTTMKVMLDEAKKLRDEPLPAKELEGTKAQLLTDTLMGRQAPSDQGYALAVAQLYAGDWRKERALLDMVKAVTAPQIQAWAKKSITRMKTFVIGDKSKIDVAPLEQF